MCGYCQGKYSYCQACQKTVKKGRISRRCAYEEDCSDEICDKCVEKCIIYCKFCVEVENIIEIKLEKCKKELEKLTKELEIHNEFYKILK